MPEQPERPAVPDDVWERFVRDNTPQPAAAPEPRQVQPSANRKNYLRTAIAVPALAAAVTAVLVLLPIGGKAHDRDQAKDAKDAAPAAAHPSDAAPAITASLPPDAPAALPSLLARPVITGERAFPDAVVKGRSGQEYRRVDTATTTDCSRVVSEELAALLDQSRGCLRSTAALYVDSAKKARISVTVMSFRKVEDAATVMGMATMSPVRYQVVSLDPPPGSDLPPLRPGGAGVLRRVMTVRSVVFANAEWADGRTTGEAELTAMDSELLDLARMKVAAYEQGKAG
ncbi:hypothetical protein [Streptomyces sp. ISL-11]|uniref:hypothetical protein n=1 Tax=Streptomyces sp. ISL-11 TaxID=2819174 RepID=UPI001BE70C27|nr:hypothetical protein [Streptomyces sp. ISL-11]MBT2382526.1 hypothetical protein [Streptomyces sp. ISL-11]